MEERWENIEPLIEVASKLPHFDHPSRSRVWSQLPAERRLRRPCASQVTRSSLLQSAREFPLEVQGYVSDFVQKQRAVGALAWRAKNIGKRHAFRPSSSEPRFSYSCPAHFSSGRMSRET